MIRQTIILSALLVSISLSIFSQEKQPPAYYLNSVSLDWNKVYVNPLRIDSIFVKKDVPNGEICIFTKDRRFSTLSLNNVLKQHADINCGKSHILFRINNKVIEDSTGVRIDNTFFIYVESNSLYNVKYLDQKSREITIVNIDLEKEERKPTIYIRGINELINDNSKE